MIYTLEELIRAAKYAYDYRGTTQFPEKTFEDNCENNLKQMLLYWERQENDDDAE